MSALALRSNLSAAMTHLQDGDLPLAALRYKRAVQEWQYLGIDDPEINVLTFAVAVVKSNLEDALHELRQLQLRDEQDGSPEAHEAGALLAS